MELRQTGFIIQWWVKLAVVGVGCIDTMAEDCRHDSAWALRPVHTSHCVNENAEGVHVVRAARRLQHVLSEAEFVVHLVVLSTEVNLDVPPLSRSAWKMTYT